MNSREKFLETMKFNKSAKPNKWEFGFWGGTINRWYEEGLPKKKYPRIPTNIINTTASLYTPAITHEWRKNKNLFEIVFNEPEHEIRLPKGIAVMSGGATWPNHGYSRDHDVKDYFNFDDGLITVNAEQLIYPHFEVKMLEETDRYVDYRDIDGSTRRFSKIEQVLPAGIDWIIKNEKDWFEVKEEKFSLLNIKDRLPNNWQEHVKEYNNRSYPLLFGGYPNGIFGCLTHLIGYENLFMFYYDKPALIKDMLDRITDIWIALWEEISADVEIDGCNFWEDISSGKGSMISPKIFREFVLPYYKKISNFLKSKKIEIFTVDTDGDCSELVPLFIEGGVTCLYPMEVSAGMDVVKCRKDYPNLQMMGGIPKDDISKGKEAIDKFLEPVEWMLKQGGYIPFGDHYIIYNVSWKDFVYYREKLNKMIDSL